MSAKAGGVAGLSLAGLLAMSFLIKPHESKVNETYVDPVGIYTSCYGHTGPEVAPERVYSDVECEKLLHEDVIEHDSQLMRLVKVPLNDEMRAALISFVYNVGAGNLASSTLLKKLNAGDYIGACHELPRWIYGGGRPLGGLVRRREAELQLCLQGARKHAETE
ncbi:lysozyme [Gilvimarinus chinensis]|uniref:lysozyme n=1 Tax=Gilvimarinus chinensis TaxID=396005 RepID=UPI0003733272|nr:lysozyme [Gilvimarinus chinensis]